MTAPGRCSLCGGLPVLIPEATDCPKCWMRAAPAPLDLEPEQPEPAPDQRPALVVLVGCGKDKRPGTHAARDLYTGPIFTAGRRWAEQRIDQEPADVRAEWLIVSAKHGAIQPDQEIESYDQRLPQATEDRRCWGMNAATTIRLRYAHSRTGRIVILAGADYADAIRPHLEREGWTITEPLRGLGTGHRRAWMNSHRKESQP